MTETEKRYAQIEKEALAATWACEWFSNYVLGRTSPHPSIQATPGQI